jgi:hypothetical protein
MLEEKRKGGENPDSQAILVGVGASRDFFGHVQTIHSKTFLRKELKQALIFLEKLSFAQSGVYY